MIRDPSDKKFIDIISQYLPEDEKHTPGAIFNVGRIKQTMKDFVKRELETAKQEKRMRFIMQERRGFLNRKQKARIVAKIILAIGGTGLLYKGTTNFIEYLSNFDKLKNDLSEFLFNFWVLPEKHTPNSNFNGPFTDLKNRLSLTYKGSTGTSTYHIPNNIIDYIAFKHDIGYSSNNKANQALFDGVYNYDFNNLEETLNKLGKKGLIKQGDINKIIKNQGLTEKFSNMAIYYKDFFNDPLKQTKDFNTLIDGDKNKFTETIDEYDNYLASVGHFNKDGVFKLSKKKSGIEATTQWNNFIDSYNEFLGTIKDIDPTLKEGIPKITENDKEKMQIINPTFIKLNNDAYDSEIIPFLEIQVEDNPEGLKNVAHNITELSKTHTISPYITNKVGQSPSSSPTPTPTITTPTPSASIETPKEKIKTKSILDMDKLKKTLRSGVEQIKKTLKVSTDEKEELKIFTGLYLDPSVTNKEFREVFNLLPTSRQHGLLKNIMSDVYEQAGPKYKTQLGKITDVFVFLDKAIEQRQKYVYAIKQEKITDVEPNVFSKAKQIYLEKNPAEGSKFVNKDVKKFLLKPQTELLKIIDIPDIEQKKLFLEKLIDKINTDLGADTIKKSSRVDTKSNNADNTENLIGFLTSKEFNEVFDSERVILSDKEEEILITQIEFLTGKSKKKIGKKLKSDEEKKQEKEQEEQEEQEEQKTEKPEEPRLAHGRAENARRVFLTQLDDAESKITEPSVLEKIKKIKKEVKDHNPTIKNQADETEFYKFLDNRQIEVQTITEAIPPSVSTQKYTTEAKELGKVIKKQRDFVVGTPAEFTLNKMLSNLRTTIGKVKNIKTKEDEEIFYEDLRKIQGGYNKIASTPYETEIGATPGKTPGKTPAQMFSKSKPPAGVKLVPAFTPKPVEVEHATTRAEKKTALGKEIKKIEAILKPGGHLSEENSARLEMLRKELQNIEKLEKDQKSRKGDLKTNETNKKRVRVPGQIKPHFKIANEQAVADALDLNPEEQLREMQNWDIFDVPPNGEGGLGTTQDNQLAKQNKEKYNYVNGGNIIDWMDGAYNYPHSTDFYMPEPNLNPNAKDVEDLLEKLKFDEFGQDKFFESFDAKNKGEYIESYNGFFPQLNTRDEQNEWRETIIKSDSIYEHTPYQKLSELNKYGVEESEFRKNLLYFVNP